MTSKVFRIIDHIIEIEGGYVNDPDDSGGKTMYGITESVARDAGYAGPMQGMSRLDAVAIYAELYWLPVHGGELEEMSEAVAMEVMDTAVNQGVGRASEFLQRSLNVLNRGGALYPDVKVDRDIGPATLSAYRAYMGGGREDAEKVLLNMLNCLQGAFYVELAERREKDESFIYGWFRNRVAVGPK